MNLELLHILLGRKFFWPHIPTQLALVIFVTDRNDPNLAKNNYILQKNLRTTKLNKFFWLLFILFSKPNIIINI